MTSTFTKTFMRTYNCLRIVPMIALLSILILQANAQVSQTTSTCTGFRTQTQGGWGTAAHGGNPGTYRDANFAGAFPNGLTIGCNGGNKLVLTSSAAVQAFLPSGSTPSVLPAGTLNNPTRDNYSNVLAGQLVTAVLNVGFDTYDPNFSSNALHTGDLTITKGTFAGKTVNELIAEANLVIGGCATTHTPSELNDALSAFNENYDDGKTDKGYTSCTPVCNLSVKGTKTDITCNGSANGSIDITVTGNHGLVTYLWNDNSTDEDRAGLSSGEYSVQVSDAAGCKANSETFSINEPSVLAVDGAAVNVTTVGGSDGSIDVTVTGGTGSYTYLWNDAVTTEDRTGIAAGNYSVIVTDHNGCTGGKTFVVSGPNCNLVLGGKLKPVSCWGGNDGAIDLTVSGGISPYTYLWNDGATTEDRTNLKAGRYSVTVTDSKGCSVTSRTVPVRQPDRLKVSDTVTAQTQKYVCDGTAKLAATGGTPPYKFTWEDGYVGATRTGLCMGIYHITVTDKRGCSCVHKIRIPCGDYATQQSAPAAEESALSTKLSTAKVSVSPNPATDLVKVTINAVKAGDAMISVYDFNGKLVLHNKANLVQGVNQQQLNLSSFAKGLYQVQVVSDEGTSVIKVVLN